MTHLNHSELNEFCYPETSHSTRRHLKVTKFTTTSKRNLCRHPYFLKYINEWIRLPQSLPTFLTQETTSFLAKNNVLNYILNLDLETNNILAKK